MRKQPDHKHWSQRVHPEGNGCLIWDGTIDRRGKPIIYIWNGTYCEQRHAAVWAYTDEKGERPKGHLRRTCGNDRCVAPAHAKLRRPPKKASVPYDPKKALSLRVLRHRAGLSQVALACEIGIGYNSISHLERFGKFEKSDRKLTPREKEKLAAKLGVTDTEHLFDKWADSRKYYEKEIAGEIVAG